MATQEEEADQEVSKEDIVHNTHPSHGEHTKTLLEFLILIIQRRKRWSWKFRRSCFPASGEKSLSSVLFFKRPKLKSWIMFVASITKKTSASRLYVTKRFLQKFLIYSMTL